MPRRKGVSIHRKHRNPAVAEAETQYLPELLPRTNGDIPQTCALSGLSRARLHALLKKYGLI